MYNDRTIAEKQKSPIMFHHNLKIPAFRIGAKKPKVVITRFIKSNKRYKIIIEFISNSVKSNQQIVSKKFNSS